MKKKNPLLLLAWILVIIGALNWGLYGTGYFIGQNLNVVNLLLGAWPTVEAVVYILVGLAAVYKVVACGMGACGCGKDCNCGSNCDCTGGTPKGM